MCIESILEVTFPHFRHILSFPVIIISSHEIFRRNRRRLGPFPWTCRRLRSCRASDPHSNLALHEEREQDRRLICRRSLLGWIALDGRASPGC